MVVQLTGPLVEAAWGALRSGVARLDRRLAWGLLIAAVLLLLVGLTESRFRNWVAERVEDAHEAIRQGIEDMQQIHQAATEAQKTLARLHPDHRPPQTARGYITYVLARAPGPLSAAALTRRMQDQGYRSRSVHPERHVARVLRAHPQLFERDAQKYWRLRSHRASGSSHTAGEPGSASVPGGAQ